MRIIPYSDTYKQQMIDMVLEAKAALGLPPAIRADMYDIKRRYLDKGDRFYLALDEDGTVIGCLGYSRIADSTEAFLRRFYVKASRKRQGIGTALLNWAEAAMREAGIEISKVHLGEAMERWFESYAFYPKNGYAEHEPRYMRKRL